MGACVHVYSMWGCSEEVNHNKTISAIFETDLPQKTTSDLKYTPLCLVKDPPSVGGQNKPLATCTIHTCPNRWNFKLHAMSMFQAAHYTHMHTNCMQCPCSRQQTTHTCTQTACSVHVPGSTLHTHAHKLHVVSTFQHTCTCMSSWQIMWHHYFKWHMLQRK